MIVDGKEEVEKGKLSKNYKTKRENFWLIIFLKFMDSL